MKLRPPRMIHSILLLCAATFALSVCSSRPDIPSVQQFYGEGVPHTDRRGRMRFDFDAKQSFLPLAIYHALAGEHYGKRYQLGVLSAAGFNTVHLWEKQAPETFADRLREAQLQMIVHWPNPESIAALSREPSLLAWYLDEEPSFIYPAGDTKKRFAKFERDRDTIRRIDTETPILVLDGPPTAANRARWDRWNLAGDISSHFNYPVTVKRLRDYGPVERVAETTTIARKLVDQRRPLWMTLQAFGGEARGWRKPSPKTVRAMSYAAIVHGATGLIYFAYDSFVTRDDGILGISPSPERDYRVKTDYNADGKPPLIASDADRNWSRALFGAVAKLNAEMNQLRGVILSPTSALKYTVQPANAFAWSHMVRCLLKKSNAGYTLITVNVDTEPASVDFRFPDPIKSITPLFNSARPDNVDAHGYTVNYAGEAVGVYRIEFAP